MVTSTVTSCKEKEFEDLSHNNELFIIYEMRLMMYGK